MKVVGTRLQEGSALADQGRLARTAAALRGTPALARKGVYRFSSHDEAERWMTMEMQRTHAHLSHRTSPGSAER
jgi:hypothetical protein